MNFSKAAFAALFFLLLISTVSANEKYSYENSERLKPLIEWRDYGPPAFAEAQEQGKPIFLLLTAPTWCYWCQVYESEDYLFNSEVVEFINANMIPIYVDADQRQDLTRQYLEGGWPSTTVMTPSRERLYGFSGVRPVPNMIANFKQAVDHVNTQSFSSVNTYEYTNETPRVPTANSLENFLNGYAGIIIQSYDPEFGGFGGGQKFPQGRTLFYALELYEKIGNSQWLDLVRNTLKNQYTDIREIETNYNLFDPVEGGFHRYGTRRDWTPPHYEKMLYDNARLLRTYIYLRELDPDNAVAREVVEKTQGFIERNWWDSEEGGFYGNSDVHGEDAYYGKNPRPEEKPRVERTKYSDWNSEAIITYLSAYELTGKDIYRTMAKGALDFFAREMVTVDGAYHFMTPTGEKQVRGSLLDNAYLTLAFVEGYDVLEDEIYLDRAVRLADYSVSNLYDWNGGGFFERNSPDTEQYAPGEHVRLTKPSAENGIMSYAMLKLYGITRNTTYLGAGIRSTGLFIDRTGGLDRGFYHARSAEIILDEDLLGEFSRNQNAIEETEAVMRSSFWLNELLNPTEFETTDEGTESLRGSLVLLMILALIAGILSFASPCTAPIIPAYLAHVFQASKKSIKGMTISFFAGLSLLFTLLGMSATAVGTLLRDHMDQFSRLAGIAMMVIGLLIIAGRGFSGPRIRTNKPTSYLTSFFLGAAMGISWTPCVGPILVAILIMATTTNSVLTGGLLLFTYSVGLALPLILFSTYLQNHKGRIWKFIEGRELTFKFGKKKLRVHSTSLISGVLLILIGFLIFIGAPIIINKFVGVSGIQRWIIGLEEKILSLMG